MKAAFNKILHRKKKPKTLSTGPGLNQSMINIIVHDNENNDSFRSHQPDIARSPSIVGNDFEDFTDRFDNIVGSPDKIRIKGNISSVLNVPKKRSIIHDLYEIFHDHVIDQLGEIISSKKGAVQRIEIPKVHLNDFKDYIARLKPVHGLYKKQNAKRIRKRKEIQQTDIKGSLTQCFSSVPSQYFDEDFLFNFEYLTNDKSKITQVQEDLVNYLDTVEANLYLQLTTRFQEFVDVILKLSQMEAQIQSSLRAARFFRGLNKELRIKCSDEVKNVLKIRRKKTNIEKVLQLLSVVSSVRKTIPTLVQLVEKNNLQGAINLIKSSEEVYQKELTGVKTVKNFNIDFNDAKKTLENLVTEKVEEKSFAYLSQTLNYTKKSQTLHFPDVSMVEESFMNVSTIDGSVLFDDEPSSHLSLNWTLNSFQRNEHVEENQANTILEYIKFRVLPMNKYKEKLSELLNKFHNKFLVDMDEYITNLTSNKAVPVQENSLFDLHIKFVLFYFNLIKRFIQTQFQLNTRTISKLVKYINQNWNKVNGNEQLKSNLYSNFQGTVEELYSALDLACWHFNHKMSEIVTRHSIENISIHQFTKFNALFSEINIFLQEELKIKENLENIIQTNIEEIKISLIGLHEEHIQKMNFDLLFSLKEQSGKNYIASFHKSNLELLKQSLEQDSWQVSDIPYTYKVYFDLILRGITNQRKESFAEKQDNEEEDIFRSSRPDVNDLEIVKKLATGDNLTMRENQINSDLCNEGEKHEKDTVEIKKSELILADRKFKINSSILVLIRQICDYYNIAFKFDYLTETSLSKLFDLLKFYNSFSRRLISNAEATMFGKVKKITAKILGLSIVSLDLIQSILSYLNETLERTILNVKDDFLSKEFNSVNKEIESHISEIKLKICLILKTKLVEQCNELKYLNWGSNEGKINIPTKSSASILHNIRQMYKNIEDVLFKEQLMDLFNSIFFDLKENYIPIFENLEVENKLAAKRIKEELEYFKDDLHHIPIFQQEELNFTEFEEKIMLIIESKCNCFLTLDKNEEIATE